VLAVPNPVEPLTEPLRNAAGVVGGAQRCCRCRRVAQLEQLDDKNPSRPDENERDKGVHEFHRVRKPCRQL